MNSHDGLLFPARAIPLDVVVIAIHPKGHNGRRGADVHSR